MSTINHYKYDQVKGAADVLTRKTKKTHVVVKHTKSARYEICTVDKFRELVTKVPQFVIVNQNDT